MLTYFTLFYLSIWCKTETWWVLCYKISELNNSSILWVLVLFFWMLDTSLLLLQMATLAAYFGLGQQTHRYFFEPTLQWLILVFCWTNLFCWWFFRSLDDVRMNLEVLKYCATVLFLVKTSNPSMTHLYCPRSCYCYFCSSVSLTQFLPHAAFFQYLKDLFT